MGSRITLVLFVIRIFAVKLVIGKNSPLLDKATISIMIPKGLGWQLFQLYPYNKIMPMD
ncbi:MAG: hypothetical protein IPP46_19145 [Bacteroidetes bacterium]|nr:hypothetical protein [Bacteroidota bacterium]